MISAISIALLIQDAAVFYCHHWKCRLTSGTGAVPDQGEGQCFWKVVRLIYFRITEKCNQFYSSFYNLQRTKLYSVPSEQPVRTKKGRPNCGQHRLLRVSWPFISLFLTPANNIFFLHKDNRVVTCTFKYINRLKIIKETLTTTLINKYKWQKEARRWRT